MTNYSIIEIYTSEDIHWKGKSLYLAIIDVVRNLKIAARCIVTRALEGCFENGEIASSRFEVWSVRMPLKIEVLLPANELDLILPDLKTMVVDGIITVREMNVVSHRTAKHLIPRHLYVKDVMTKNPITAKQDSSISEIIQVFTIKGLYSAPIVDNRNVPVGILTETDLIKKAHMPVRLGLLSHFESKVHELLPDFEKMTTREIMSSPVHVISEDEHLTKAVDVLLKYNIKRLPVVTRDGTLSGILSIYDILQAITEHSPKTTMLVKHIDLTNAKSVADVLISDCPVVSPDTAIEDVVRCIDVSPLQRVAVVDSAGKLLGLIFDHDLLSLFSDYKDAIWDHLLSAISFTEIGRIHKEKIRTFHLKCASEIMRKENITVLIDAPVEVAVRLISENKIRFLPVVDNEGVFKGVISREALMQADC
jgi:CBS domain-containing protein